MDPDDGSEDCRSESSHSDNQFQPFQEYERMNKCFNNNNNNAVNNNNSGSVCSLLAQQQQQEVNFHTLDLSNVPQPISRLKQLHVAKDYISHNSRETRIKNSPYALGSDKDYNVVIKKDPTTTTRTNGIFKNYNIEKMKEFHLSRTNQFALERLLEPNEFMSLPMQTRNGGDFEAIALAESMRQSRLFAAAAAAAVAQTNLSTQLTAHSTQLHSLSQIQHGQQIQQQQQLRQQPKSFTIDAILGMENGQKEKRGHQQQQQQQQQYRKQYQGEESSTKGSSNGNSCPENLGGGENGGRGTSGGKVKRVRTIFTGEQLEQLEGQFARQQYMVGAERLQLAHALRLTEAQVKVWFQNRRIKWRKFHHEQQSVRVHELRRSLGISLDHEDSNDTDK